MTARLNRVWRVEHRRFGSIVETAVLRPDGWEDPSEPRIEVEHLPWDHAVAELLHTGALVRVTFEKVE